MDTTACTFQNGTFVIVSAFVIAISSPATLSLGRRPESRRAERPPLPPKHTHMGPHPILTTLLSVQLLGGTDPGRRHLEADLAALRQQNVHGRLGVLGELALHPQNLGGGLGAELDGGFVPAGSCEDGGGREEEEEEEEERETGRGRGGTGVSRHRSLLNQFSTVVWGVTGGRGRFPDEGWVGGGEETYPRRRRTRRTRPAARACRPRSGSRRRPGPASCDRRGLRDEAPPMMG